MSASHLTLCSHTVRVRQISAKPLFVQIAGDLTTATLLTQIVFWSTPNKRGQSKLRVVRHGHRWVAKTREVWMAETGLGAAQYKRAIRVLKQKGLIEVRKMRFGGLAISHIRLLTETFKAAESSALSLGRKSPNGSGGLRPIGRAVSAQLSTETTAETTDRDHEHSSCEDARARAGENEDPDRDQGEKGSGKPREDRGLESRQHEQTSAEGRGDVLDLSERIQATTSIDEYPALHALDSNVVAMIRAALPSSPTLPTKESPLISFWRAQITTLDPGYQKPTTSKEAGQIKQLQKYLGNQAEPVIAYALSHWLRFASAAAAKEGTAVPVSPHIGFLLKHHAVAVNLMKPDTPDPVMSKPAPSPPPMLPTALEKQEQYHLTADELETMLADLKK